jgi:hypothetical protein
MIFWFFYKNEMLPNTSIATDVLPNNIAFPRLMRYIFYFGLPKSDKLLVLFLHWDAPMAFLLPITAFPITKKRFFLVPHRYGKCYNELVK